MGLPILDKLFGGIERAPHWSSDCLPRERRPVAAGSLMAATRREVALLSAEMMGVQTHIGQFGKGSGEDGLCRGDRRLFRDMIEDTPQSFMVIDPRPGLHIIDVNDAFAGATLTPRRRAAGERLFDVFPDNPDDPEADGVCNLYESIQRAAQTGRSHAMAVQRYDVQDRAGGFVQKLWQPVNIPIFDETGRLAFVLHQSVDVTPQ